MGCVSVLFTFAMKSASPSFSEMLQKQEKYDKDKKKYVRNDHKSKTKTSKKESLVQSNGTRIDSNRYIVTYTKSPTTYASLSMNVCLCASVWRARSLSLSPVDNASALGALKPTLHHTKVR